MIENTDAKGTSRRSLLQSAGLVSAAVGLVAAVPAGAAPVRRHTGGATASDVAVMQGALALEHEGIAAYKIAGGSGLLSPEVLAVALVFLGHHEGHRDALAKLIARSGGKPVEPKSNDEYIKSLNIAALKNQADVIRFAAGLEQGATNAYVGQVAALQDKATAHLFGQLGADEAVHWALLNNAAGGTVPKAAFLFS
ncbi:MAG: ferritin-like domain-containing protein [Sphingomonadaceae bacterium]|nr:ferritin-like domain-containing protein [Sphingomonadaceae bacterium]